MNLTRLLTTLVTATCVTIAGCGEQHQPPAPLHQTKPKVPVSYGPELQQVLPDNALAYVRIPNPWGLLFSPKGDVFDTAFAGAAHADAILALQKKFYGQLLADGAKPNPFDELLLRQLRSPLELALLPPGEAQPPLPNLYATARLTATTVDQVNGMLREYAASAPNLKLVQPLEADHDATLLAGPLAIYVHFDAHQQRISLMAGTGLTERTFDVTRMGLKPTQHKALAAMESRIDTSGQGLFAWADVAGLIALAKPMLAPDKLRKLETSPLRHVRSIAAGWGVANGKGRVRIEARLDTQDLNQYVSVPGKALDVKAAGAPRAVAVLALPGPEQLNNIKRLIAERGGLANYKKLDDRLRSSAGISLEDISAAIGPEMITVSDAAGEYTAIRVRNKKAWTELIDHLTQATKAPNTVSSVDGQAIHHLVLPSLMYSGAGKAGHPTVASRLLAHLHSHTYWVEDGDYVVLASVPQILRDRAHTKQHVSIADWLARTQHESPATGVVTLSASLQDSPRRLYYGYLGLMEMIGDIAGVPVDLDQMPSAQQLGLPERGGVGLQAQVQGDDVALELSFDSNPVEVLAGGSNPMTTVAVVGILAAIAIPAYQDYTLRAHVAAAYAFGAALVPLMNRYRTEHGDWPDAQALAGVHPPADVQRYLADMSVDSNTGILVLKLRGAPQLIGGQMTFTPRAVGGNTEWHCSSNLPPKYIPRQCR